MKTPLTRALARHVEFLEEEIPGSEGYSQMVQEAKTLSEAESKLLEAKGRSLDPWVKGLLSFASVAFLVIAETTGHAIVSKSFGLIPKG